MEHPAPTGKRMKKSAFPPLETEMSGNFRKFAT